VRSVVGVEQATAWRCICTSLETALAESLSATVGSRGGAVISRRRAPKLSRVVQLGSDAAAGKIAAIVRSRTGAVTD
jgi:hypothetical protein